MPPTKARKRSGSYVLDISIKGPDGKLKRIQRSGFATLKERDDEEERLRTVARKGIDPLSPRTVADLGRAIVQDKRDSLKASTTVSNYKQAFAYIDKVIGHVKLVDITDSGPINTLRAVMLAGDPERGIKKRTPATVHCYLRQLRSAMQWAVEQRWMDRNVARESKLPTVPKKPFELPTHEQVKRVVAEAAADSEDALHYGIYTHLLAVTGLRRNEALELRWEHVNQRELSLFITGGKTDAARRTVSVSQNTMDKILSLQDRRLAGSGYVFVRADGSRIAERSVTGLFNRLSERCGFYIHAHALRHYHASTCLETGMDFKALQERLGHKSISVTMNIYGHLRPGFDRDAANRAAALLD